MSIDQAIGVFIVAAKHHFSRVILEEYNQFIKIFSRTAFPDEDLHAKSQFDHGLCDRHAFMICTDSGINIFFCGLAAQAWCMSVNWLSKPAGSLDFLQYFHLAV